MRIKPDKQHLIKEAFDKKGEPYQAVAKAIGCTYNPLHSFVNGKTRNFGWLQAFCDYVGLNINEIIETPINKKTPTAKSASAPTPQETRDIQKTTSAITIACMKVINEMEDDGTITEDASPLIEKVITFYWTDFVEGTPPDHATIRRFVEMLL